VVGQSPYLCRSNVPLVSYHAYIVGFVHALDQCYAHNSYDLDTAMQITEVDIAVIVACANLSQS